MNLEEAFVDELIVSTERYLNQLGVTIVEKYLGTWDNMKNEGYTAMLEIKGEIQGFFLLRVETSLAYSLVNHYILEAVEETEILGLADKVVAEIANIIVGITLSEREELDLILGVPNVYFSSEILLRPEALAREIKCAMTEDGIYQCMFIRSDEMWHDF
jgi:CheY-specific phosphatase CheX